MWVDSRKLATGPHISQESVLSTFIVRILSHAGLTTDVCLSSLYLLLAQLWFNGLLLCAARYFEDLGHPVYLFISLSVFIIQSLKIYKTIIGLLSNT